MLLGLLLPDPCDPHCPEDFKNKARELLPKVQGNPGPEDMDLRKALLKFIGDFSNWDLSANQTYLKVSRGLVRAAHPEETPLVVDPFAGGGSIPLEALRLGCEAFASDLNPFACLILKVMLEDIPRYGPELADELRRVGEEFLEKVWEMVGRTALEQVLGTAEAKTGNSTAGALEEDARLTALFLWMLQSTNWESPSPRPSPSGLAFSHT